MNRALSALLLAATLASCTPAPTGTTGGTHTAATVTDLTAELAKPGLLLVDFYADWCPPCKTMKPIVDRVQTDYTGKLRVLAINIDHHPEIARRYHVSSIPDFVILKDGQTLDNRLGAMPEKQFRNWLDGFIAAAQ